MGVAGVAAAVGAAGSLASGVSSMVGGSQAAGANQQAQQLQYQMWQQSLANQMPFIQVGQAQLPLYGQLAQAGGQNALAAGTAEANLLGIGPAGGAGSPYQQQIQNMLGIGPAGASGMNAALAQTPGYQFALNQGLQSVQNSAAAQGLGVSSPALAGAAQYATGLASQTYNQQLNNLMNAYGQQAGLLQGFGGQQAGYLQNLANLGQNTAVGAGAQAVQSGIGQASSLNQMGQALGAGTVGLGAGIGGAANTLASSPQAMNALSNLFSGGSTLTPSTPSQWGTTTASATPTLWG